MAEKTLGPEFWIHGGGLDLVFPHHENERAQSQAVGRPFARIWMHNGLLRFTGEKMSKSVGNVATIQEVIAEWGREAALLFLMTGHWRKPLEFSEETMTAARRAGRELPQRACAARRAPTRRLGASSPPSLDDDFNTPGRPRDPPPLGARGRARRAAARARDLRARLARRRGRGAGRGRRARRARAGGAGARATSPSRDRLRDEIAAAGWEVRDVPAPAASSSCRCGDPRPRLRPQRRARGAARPPRGARALGLASGPPPRSTGSAKARGRRSSRSAS